MQVSLPRAPGSPLLIAGVGRLQTPGLYLVVRQHFVSHPASVYTLATTETLLGYFRCAAAPMPCSCCISSRCGIDYGVLVTPGLFLFESVLNLVARPLLRLKRPGPHVTNHSVPRFVLNRESERQRVFYCCTIERHSSSCRLVVETIPPRPVPGTACEFGGPAC